MDVKIFDLVNVIVALGLGILFGYACAEEATAACWREGTAVYCGSRPCMNSAACAPGCSCMKSSNERFGTCVRFD